ncbi:MAG TPA: T9SS type A sorting domain-containing protein [Bacteroidales bacterium]|nr:T9SS type A sorting domain-containing protein [Bacteroidales bacterium]
MNSVQLEERLQMKENHSKRVMYLEKAPEALNAPIIQQLDSTVKTDATGKLFKTAYQYNDNGKTTLEKNFFWDKTTNSWIPTAKTVSNYNSDGNLTLLERMSFDKTANVWNSNSKYERIWGEDKDGNWIFTAISYSMDYESNQLVYSTKEETVLRGKTMFIKRSTIYEWDESTSDWVPSSRSEQERDDGEFEYSFADFKYNKEKNTWDGKKTGMGYDNIYKIYRIIAEFSDWNESTKTWGVKTIYGDFCPEITNSETKYINVNGEWQPISKIAKEGEYTVYYALQNGELVKSHKELQKMDEGGNEIEYYRDNYIIENSSSVSSLWRTQKWVWNMGNYELLQKRERASGHGGELYYIQLYKENAQSPWNSSYSYKQESFYDEKNQLKTFLLYSFNGEFVLKSKREIFRDESNYILYDVNYTWTNNTWVETSRTTYYYTAHQTVLVEEPPVVNADGTGTVGVKFNIPTNLNIQEGTFTVSLPDGVSIDEAKTALSAALSTTHTLSIVNNNNGTWTFTIKANSGGADPISRRMMSAKYQDIAKIAYIVPQGTSIGEYNAHITDVNIILSDNSTIVQQDIPFVIKVAEVVSSTIKLLHQKIQIYPNPAKEFITIEGAKGNTLLIYDIDGKKIMDRIIKNDTEKIFLMKFSTNNVLLIRILEDNKEIGTMKLVVK